MRMGHMSLLRAFSRSASMSCLSKPERRLMSPIFKEQKTFSLIPRSSPMANLPMPSAPATSTTRSSKALINAIIFASTSALNLLIKNR
ncbi:hypothetical protein CPB83DRAFT_861810 [Crepidotus variabilis]|uniref:Uncharacterized protein n=1 Tax=Crepidotus variabilis TaxID=179855 RepID=A0A9P6JKW5_9AGAR|nr:hypothetical protein CPB83DRAFT_861810 [Crepidotus variabilis]